MKDPMLDKDFLIKLDNQKQREIYAKIISLTWNEDPIEEITGRVSNGGSINIDGTSAVRRTCSLTLVAQDVNINNYYWGLNTKFKLSIGIKNTTDSSYPEIIWFKQGTYVITQFKSSLQANSYTISISGKDKMCLLNGDVGGSIESVSADFGKYDEIDEDGNITTKDYLLKDTILEAVHHYGKEPFHNIIIEDLDSDGLELMEYRGDADLYIFFNTDTTMASNMKFDDDTVSESDFIYELVNEITNVDDDGNTQVFTSVSLRNAPNAFKFDNRITSIDLSDTEINDATVIKDLNGNTYTVAKITYGDTCGYRLTDLTFAGDLILSTGDKLTSALDKIVQMLGDYEYFYNLDGQFVFRKKHTYQNTSWNTIKSGEETYVDNAAYSSSCIYSFADSNLISAFANDPNLLNLRNDFSIWGTKNDTNKTQFHLRYAVDNKPVYYKNYNGKIFLTQEEYDKKISDSNAEDLNSETITIVGQSKFKVTPLIDGLSDDWWEIGDWTRRYLYLADTNNENTLDYYLNLTDTDVKTIIEECYNAVKDNAEPTSFQITVSALWTKSLSEFATTWPPYIDWNTICPKPESTTLSSNVSSLYDNLASGRIFWTFLVDIAIDSATNLPYIALKSHGSTYTTSSIAPTTAAGTGCSHKFYYAIDEKKDQIKYVYIYSPKIPDSVKQDASVTTVKINNSTEVEEITTSNYEICDWREIIYQMSIDYYKYGHNGDFNPVLASNNLSYYPTGYTGYEQYYTDMQGFWRYIYNPELEPILLTEEKINKGTAVPDPDKYHYYVWDRDNQVFDTYTLKTATSIKPVESNEKYYYKYGTISWQDLREKINNGEAKCIANKEAVYGITDLNEYMFACYASPSADDPQIIYHWLNKTTYEVYYKYHNYSDSENYYDYDLALDLSGLSQTTPYYYANKIYKQESLREENYETNKYYYKDENTSNFVLSVDKNYIEGRTYYSLQIEYVLGETVALDDSYTYIGQVSEDLYNNKTKQFYIKDGSTYSVSDSWKSTTEYYKQMTPTNFNHFNTDYYEYKGYAKASSFAPGNTYYTKNIDNYIPCTNVLSENSCYQSISGIDNSNFKNQTLYTKDSESSYSLSTKDFDKSATYYEKKDNGIYKNITLYDPNPTGDIYYYIQDTKDEYPVASEYKENTTYYIEKMTAIDLDEDSYVKDKYYEIKKYDKQSETPKDSNGEYFLKSVSYVNVNIDKDDYDNRGDEVYYTSSDKHVLADSYDSNTTYYLQQVNYPKAAPTSTTWKTNTYWVYNIEKTKYVKDTASAYSDSETYYNREITYIPIPTLTQEDFEEETGTSKITTSVTYYVFSNGGYTEATGDWKETETYYIKDEDWVQVNLTSTTYKKNKYYIQVNGVYTISKDAFSTKRHYWKKVPKYTKDTVTKKEYDKSVKIVVSKNSKYYKETDGYKKATGDFDSSINYYIKQVTYNKASSPYSSTNTYYARKYQIVEDDAFDSSINYYSLSHSSFSVDKNGTYDWSKLFTKTTTTIYVPTQSTTKLDITYYEKANNKYPINIYRTNKYYIALNSIEVYTPAESYEKGKKYFIKKMIIFYKNGAEEKGFFGDGIHTFYLQSGDKYIKQVEYSENNKDLYYVLDDYPESFSIDINTTYYNAGSKTSNFIRGQTYCDSNNNALFTISKSLDYYVYVGYVKVKDTNGLKNGLKYIKSGSSYIQSSNYKFYPTNIYYGYTDDHIWINYVEDDDTTSSDYNNSAEHDYYIENGDDYTKVKVLHHFSRNKTYYIHSWDYDKIEADTINMNLIKFYYQLTDDGSYENCLSVATKIGNAAGDYSTETLAKIYDATGLLFSSNPSSTSATLKGIDLNHTYYLYQCAMRPYNILQYNISPLPALLYDTDEFNPDTYWTFDIENPEQLIFWIDFMDASNGSELSQYGAHSIGNRPKSVKDDDVKAIYYRDTPNIIFVGSDEELPTAEQRKSGYTYMQLTDNIDNLFEISSQGKTAYDVLDDYLYNYSYCTESITITSVPVYYLEPNARILVYDDKSGINGEYLISKISLPLTYNGTMSITATKAVDRIY